ncbi:hypothetical protein ACFY2V_04510 [Streptomyces eurythermus]|uniref:hypothetical protein n=1 Tax=Streptomyces eurythermus TaxID=42237 RepID=UPI00367E1553
MAAVDHEAMLRQRVDPELLNRIVKRRVAEVWGEARRLTDPILADTAKAVAQEAETRSKQFVIDALAAWHLRVQDAQEAEERRYEVVRMYLRWSDYMDGSVERIRRYARRDE